MKKTISILAASLALLWAGTALAQNYPSFMMQNSASAQVAQQYQQQMEGYMSQLSQGSLSAQDQMAMYQLIQSIRYQAGAGNMMYFQRSLAGGLFSGVSRQAAWFGLMFVITVVLVWAVLLLLICFLWHLLKKHRH